ncbi:hypothetical protein ACFQZZ_00330 [Nocardia sp. GCM10030253]|uniref:hypothetical protein n=1 Tax=Nocardia sp. GCM10030253 TaxID=3273404 RepID=UPI003641B287
MEWKHGADTIIAALEESAANLAEAANQYETRDATNRDATSFLRLPAADNRPRCRLESDVRVA